MHKAHTDIGLPVNREGVFTGDVMLLNIWTNMLLFYPSNYALSCLGAPACELS